MNYTEITSYEIACKVLGTTPEEDLPYATPVTGKQIFLNAVAKIETFGKAVNMKDGKEWIPTHSEDTYIPIFDLDGPSGFGFSFTYYGDWDTYTVVGARLVHRSRPIAAHAGRCLESTYKEMMVK